MLPTRGLLILLLGVAVREARSWTQIPTFHSSLAPSRPSSSHTISILAMTSSPESTKFTAKTDPSSVVVLPDADAVSKRIQSIVTDAAAEAIAERGHFILAIPGGSILKMLVNLESAADWAPKTTLVYVNHKCVPMDDADAATHAKAQKLFLNDWQNAGLNAIILSGTSDGPAEASRYERQLKDLPETICPRCAPSDAGDLPRFDLALIGVGDDGHVGSLYPDRDEVTIDEFGPWVLSVAMKDPPSITLSLPVMANAKRVVVAACGVSEKYPQGKSAGMRRAVVEEGEDLRSFPAVGLRGVATWVMDEAAASKLGPEYGAE